LIEKCFKCHKEITLVDSAYNEGMCKECYRETVTNELDSVDSFKEVVSDHDYWYEKAQQLNKALEKQDKIIDDYRKKVKLVDKWIKAYNEHIDREEEKEFIHVFRRILVEHHMDSREALSSDNGGINAPKTSI